jgi:hypothetical protein
MLADPVVQEMTHGQWLFEAQALRKKEEDALKGRDELVSAVFKASHRAFRETLIALLGLFIGAKRKRRPVEDDATTDLDEDVSDDASDVEEVAAEEEEVRTPFLPLVYYLARPDMLNDMLAEDAEDRAAEEAAEDKNLDLLNEQLMSLEEGDLEPLLTGQLSNDPYERWASPQMQQMLKELGVEVTDKPISELFKDM